VPGSFTALVTRTGLALALVVRTRRMRLFLLVVFLVLVLLLLLLGRMRVRLPGMLLVVRRLLFLATQGDDVLDAGLQAVQQGGLGRLLGCGHNSGGWGRMGEPL
jgi:hypothetical protein